MYHNSLIRFSPFLFPPPPPPPFLLQILQNGGMFICRIYEIFGRFTAGLLYVMYKLFEEVKVRHMFLCYLLMNNTRLGWGSLKIAGNSPVRTHNEICPDTSIGMGTHSDG